MKARNTDQTQIQRDSSKEVAYELRFKQRVESMQRAGGKSEDKTDCVEQSKEQCNGMHNGVIG